MKRMIVKDIILALLPIGLLLIYTYASQSLRYAAAATFDTLPLLLFNQFVPILVGAILCAALYYAWKNRASTVFVTLFCGVFMKNLFIALCAADVIRGIGTLGLGKTLLYSGTGIELAGVFDGTYIVMFWVSLISFIRAGKRRKAGAYADTAN